MASSIKHNNNNVCCILVSKDWRNYTRDNWVKDFVTNIDNTTTMMT